MSPFAMGRNEAESLEFNKRNIWFLLSENELIEFKSSIVILFEKKTNRIENWMCHFCIYYYYIFEKKRKIQFIFDLYEEKLDLILLRDKILHNMISTA